MRDFLTPKQYSETTGIPLATVRRWLREGLLAHLPKPAGVRQYRIPRTALATTTARAEAGQGSARVLEFKVQR